MRGQTIGRSAMLFIASVVLLAAFAVSAWSQTPLDPQSLVGVWSGAWTNRNLAHITGQYHLTIERVDGSKVYGQVEIFGRETAQFKIVGTLSGNRLTFGKQNPTELLIEGNQMKGTAQGSARANPHEITLMKTN
jgi:hypothetical protein